MGDNPDNGAPQILVALLVGQDLLRTALPVGADV